ncbi:MAG: SGNH/GDSL hydrolase family protein [Candidatus Limnocylindria bacterium]
MHRGVALVLAGIGLAVTGCAPAVPSPGDQEDGVRFVALGDSYTIGTSVAESERWPNQLVERIGELELVGNPAVNGYTSRDLIERELPLVSDLQPEVVTVLVGVNDVVQGVPDATYATNVAAILDTLLTQVPASRIVCVATPDYTLTPQGSAFGDPTRQRAGIERANAILGDACRSRDAHFVPDIFEISRLVAQDPGLVADDGLHPSGAQYTLWVDAIAPVVAEALGTAPATLPHE